MRLFTRTSVGIALLAITIPLAAMPVACGGKDKPATAPPVASASVSTPPAATGSAPVASATASAAPSASAPNPLAAILTTDPNQIAAMIAAAASAVPAVIGPAVPGDPIEAGIKGLAAKHAPGMQPVGGVARGDLKEGGDHVSMMVNLEPGKCYAIIGFSPKDGVRDLDLRLLVPPLYNFLAGEDVTDDNAPVIGKAPNPMCPILPVTIAYKVDISSQKGAGKAGVQLFAKTK
jgi:hypothetical protein